HEPDHIAQRAAGATAMGVHDLAPERPDHEARDPERGDAERDRHDEDAGEHAGEQVPQEQGPPGGEQPDDVQDQGEDGAHAPTLGTQPAPDQGAVPRGGTGRDRGPGRAVGRTGRGGADRRGRGGGLGDYPGRMPAPEIALTERFQTAFAAAFGPEYAQADPIIRPSQFADFQCNAAMGLAKRLGRKPRDIAAEIVAAVDLADIAETPEIAGPGFLNIRLRTDWVAAQTAELTAPSAALGVPAPERAQTVVLDYSAPNVAKEMHVGHLRTTVVGDSIARTLEKLGHTVVRQNHIGDWGTPFGMLIEHLLEVGEDSAEAELLKTDPNAFYQAARAKFDAAEAAGAADDGSDFASRARARVATLQSGDAESLRIWTNLVELSKQYFHRIYDMLDVTLTDEHLAGESTYNDQLAAVCDDLEAAGIARISAGALCVFPAGFTGRDEQPLPLIIRKSDGGYGYATTDLAALRHRVRDLGADRIGYVVGSAQELHFTMVFTSAREAGWLPEQVEAEHVKIGSVLGEDGKILRTRSGSSLRLMALLEEAVAAARTVIDELRPDLPEAEREQIAHDIGIGGVKYADLSTAH